MGSLPFALLSGLPPSRRAARPCSSSVVKTRRVPPGIAGGILNFQGEGARTTTGERPIDGAGHRTTPRRRREGAPIGNLYDLAEPAILLNLRTRPASRRAASTASRISASTASRSGGRRRRHPQRPLAAAGAAGVERGGGKTCSGLWLRRTGQAEAARGLRCAGTLTG